MKAKQPSGSEDLYHVRIRQPAVKISPKRSIIFKYPTVVGKQQTPQGPNELGLGKSQLIFPGEQKQKKHVSNNIRVKPEYKLFCHHFW